MYRYDYNRHFFFFRHRAFSTSSCLKSDKPLKDSDVIAVESLNKSKYPSVKESKFSDELIYEQPVSTILKCWKNIICFFFFFN